MSVLTFDVADFRLQFPAFVDPELYSDATLQGYWDAAVFYISPENYGYLVDGARQRAINLMVAHLTYLSDLIISGQTPGFITGSTIDKISVTLTPPPAKTQWQWWLATSPYGIQLSALLSVVGVGGLYIGGAPESSAFRKVFGVF